MAKLSVNTERLSDNLGRGKGMVLAEPLYLILASLGHPDAHEKVRTITLSAQKNGLSLGEAAMKDTELTEYIERMTAQQKNIIADPSTYTGIAEKKAKEIALRWKKKLAL